MNKSLIAHLKRDRSLDVLQSASLFTATDLYIFLIL